MSTLQEVDPLLTREQAADYLGVKPQTLASWHSSGRYELPVVKVGRSVRYKRSALEKFVERRSRLHSGQSLSSIPRELAT